MVQRINPVKTKIITQDGECQVTITLELNINLNGEVTAQAAPSVKPVEVQTDDKVDFAIPDFSSGMKLNNF